jgi:dihydroxyacetone kinase-like predicted kinase
MDVQIMLKILAQNKVLANGTQGLICMFYILMESLVGYDKQFMHNDEQRVCYT